MNRVIKRAALWALLSSSLTACRSHALHVANGDAVPFVEAVHGNCSLLDITDLGDATMLVYGRGGPSYPYGGGVSSIARVTEQSIVWDAALSRGLELNEGGWIDGSVSLFGHWPDAAWLALMHTERAVGRSQGLVSRVDRSIYHWSQSRWQRSEVVVGGSGWDRVSFVELDHRVFGIAVEPAGLTATPLDGGTSFAIFESLWISPDRVDGLTMLPSSRSSRS